MAENEDKHLTPVWIVYVDGKRLDTDHEGALQRITVDDKLNAIGTCLLEFDSSVTKVRDIGTFSFESKVSIHLGYKDECEQVFVGDVVSFEVVFNEYGHEQTFVKCCNCLYKLQNSYKAVSFESKKVSDVLKEIIENYSLKAEVDDFGAEKKYSVQSLITDYKYLMENAQKYGKTVYAYDGTVYIKDEVTILNDEIIMEWGKSLISFRGKESIENQISLSTFVGWNEETGEAITGTATVNDISVKVGGKKCWKDNSKGADGKWESTIMSSELFDNEDAKNVAKGFLLNSSFDYQTGICKTEGNYKVHPGMRVSVKYVGEKFSGEYIADRIIHRFSNGDAFTTEVFVKRNMTE